jgi:Spy/CpxP family protein refolding chaperone
VTEKRKRGRPKGGKGRTMISSSLSMSRQQWQKLDRISNKNRSSWLRNQVDKAKEQIKQTIADQPRVDESKGN